MKTAAELTAEIISKAKAMQTFNVVRKLNNSDVILSAGVIPFNLRVNKEGIMVATVHALTIEEAQEQVDTWLGNLEEGDI